MTSTQLLISALVIALLIWRVQARWKNYIGRQRFSPTRLVIFLSLFGVAALVIGALALSHHRALTMFAIGLGAGASLALVGLKLTRFEYTPAGIFFTPNSHLGIALTLLLLVQFVYRKVAMHVTPGSSPPPSVYENRAVFVMLGVSAGYFIAYNAGMLIRGKRNPPVDR